MDKSICGPSQENNPDNDLKLPRGEVREVIKELITEIIEERSLQTTFTVANVAKALKVNERTVHNWHKSGQLEFIKPSGGVVRISKEAYEKMLKKYTVK